MVEYIKTWITIGGWLLLIGACYYVYKGGSSNNDK